jgi:transposase
MARAYSLDLREKVMFFISNGGGKREASKVFGIGEDTIYRWIRIQETGNLSAKKDIFSAESSHRRTQIIH